MTANPGQADCRIAIQRTFIVIQGVRDTARGRDGQ
jgi:hypothetical protein